MNIAINISSKYYWEPAQEIGGHNEKQISSNDKVFMSCRLSFYFWRLCFYLRIQQTLSKSYTYKSEQVESDENGNWVSPARGLISR